MFLSSRLTAASRRLRTLSSAFSLPSTPACRFDAILLDISMPDMDGIEVCRRLRKMPDYATTCIIACTAHAGTRDRDDFLQQGFSSVLTKPFLLEELFAVLPAPMDT